MCLELRRTNKLLERTNGGELVGVVGFLGLGWIVLGCFALGARGLMVSFKKMYLWWDDGLVFCNWYILISC